MGAGAVGCYYGGLLARAGHDVVLIARPQHVAAAAGILAARAFDAFTETMIERGTRIEAKRGQILYFPGQMRDSILTIHEGFGDQRMGWLLVGFGAESYVRLHGLLSGREGG